MSSIKAIVTLALITILSVAFMGCSDDSTTLTQTPVDTAPPAVPSNLDGVYNDSEGVLTLSWAQNTVDADLAGYVIQRDNYGDVTVLQASPALVNSFQDSPPMGTSVYQVFAVDLVGNQSAIASFEYQLIGNHRIEGTDRDQQF